MPMKIRNNNRINLQNLTSLDNLGYDKHDEFKQIILHKISKHNKELLAKQIFFKFVAS